MLTHAAFTPHSPLLVPEVHPADRDRMKKTSDALTELAEHLYALHIDTIVVISGHEERYKDAFSLELSEKYVGDLRPFGDLSKPRGYKPATKLADRLQRHMRRAEVPFSLSTNDTLDYGAAVILRLITENLPNINILPIAYSERSAKDHIAFGHELREVIEQQPERIAVIAAGDLSHCLSADAPGGFCKEGEVFDQTIKDAVAGQSASTILNIDEAIVDAARERGYRPLLILMGLLEKTQYETEILAYESPFGVGYLTAQFHLH